MPLPGDVYLTVTYGGGLDLDSSYDTLDITSRCTSVLSEGWLYFVLQVRGEDGSRLAGELLDGSLLPGGDWGVFRMPCEDGTPDLAAIENVLVSAGTGTTPGWRRTSTARSSTSSRSRTPA